jgi:predicted RNA-binding protein (virulence factor B family)
LSDSSSPEEIRTNFQTSKKAFKQALGNLYRQRLIEIQESGIRLKK